MGHSEAGAQKHSKNTQWGTFRPGPLSTPVNGGRDRNTIRYFSTDFGGNSAAILQIALRFQRIEDHPHPNANGSYGVKSGFICHKSRSSYAIKVGSCTTFSVKIRVFHEKST